MAQSLFLLLCSCVCIIAPVEKEYSCPATWVSITAFLGQIIFGRTILPVNHHWKKNVALPPNRKYLSVSTSEIWMSDYCCSVAQSCPTLCDPTDCSTPGFAVFHHLPEHAQTHVHWVGDAIQPSHPLVPFSSRLQSFAASGFFQRVSSSHPMKLQSIGVSVSTSVLSMNIQDCFL